MQHLGFRHISIKRIKKEFNIFLNKKVKFIYIIDSIFGGRPENAKKILRYIASKNHHIQLFGFLRPELIDEELAVLLKKSKFWFIQIGLQSINPNIPPTLRNNNVPLIKKNILYLLKHNIPFQVDLIAGFPHDTVNEFIKSLQYVIEEAKPHKLRVFQLKVLPGTPLEKIALNDKKLINFNKKTLFVRSCITLSNSEIKYIMRLSNCSVALYNFLLKNRWYNKEKKYRRIDFFLRFFEFLERKNMEGNRTAKFIAEKDQKINKDRKVLKMLKLLKKKRILYFLNTFFTQVKINHETISNFYKNE